MPFRYCELEHMQYDDFTISQISVYYPFDDISSSFTSSDPTLNAVWDLCKYSIKATSFCGIYVDGDRERIPYEGDAYINQLSHYCVDSEYGMARATQEYLLQYPTWPTEWQLHMVLMAWADWIYTGEIEFITRQYELLRLKSLVDLAREDGLISTETELCTKQFERRLNLHNEKYIFDHGLKDLVDWPPGSFTEGGQGERDNHEMLPINSVVNAFHYRCLIIMSRIAALLDKDDEAVLFTAQAEKVYRSFNRLLCNDERGIYIDGESSSHASLHTNMCALAFGLVPEGRRETVINFIKSRGMACSVYAAQYLMEALYLHDEDEYALELLTKRDDRSWWNMIAAGSTVTLEAWDWKYKNNLDWNHAWGAVPANIIPRYLMGIRPLEPGYRKVLIRPRIASLTHAECSSPTVNGPISVKIEQIAGTFAFSVEIPEGVTARLDLPCEEVGIETVRINGVSQLVEIIDRSIVIDPVSAGKHTITMLTMNVS